MAVRKHYCLNPSPPSSPHSCAPSSNGSCSSCGHAYQLLSAYPCRTLYTNSNCSGLKDESDMPIVLHSQPNNRFHRHLFCCTLKSSYEFGNRQTTMTRPQLTTGQFLDSIGVTSQAQTVPGPRIVWNQRTWNFFQTLRDRLRDPRTLTYSRACNVVAYLVERR